MNADKLAEYRERADELKNTNPHCEGELTWDHRCPILVNAAVDIEALCDEVERLSGKRCDTFGGYLAEYFPEEVERAVARDAEPGRLGELWARHHGFLLRKHMDKLAGA